MNPVPLAIGESVEFIPQRFDSNAPTGLFVIVATCQRESGAVYYRVRHITDGYDLLARDSEIRLAPGLLSPTPRHELELASPAPLRH